MADAYATYAGTTFSTITWTERHDPVIESGATTGYTRTYAFSSRFLYANYSAYSTGIAAVTTSLTTPAGTLLIKDPSDNQLRSFAASDCADDGPHVKFSIRDVLGYGFWVDVEISGGLPPAGSGTTVDQYEDKWEFDTQGAGTYTRTGTKRSSTAYTSIAAALTAAAPSPDNTWELDAKDGTLDEDMKELKYAFRYKQYFETIPSAFKEFSYSMSHGRDGRKDDIRLTASGGVDYANKSSIESMAETLESWAKGKIPKDAKISSISPVENKRDGTCSITIEAVAGIGGDVLEEGESRTTTRNADYVIRKRAGGGGAWIVDLGDRDDVYEVSGYKIGLNNYPAVSVSGRSQRETYHDPVKGPDGELIYRVDYSYSTPLVGAGFGGGQNAQGGGGGGGGGAAGGGTSGSVPTGTGGGFGVNNGSNGGLWGNQSGFSTGGLVSGAAGGISGTRSGFATFG